VLRATKFAGGAREGSRMVDIAHAAFVESSKRDRVPARRLAGAFQGH
jgi:hypothetical protein